MGDRNGGSLIEIDDQEEVEDPFLAFIDYAKTVISPEEDEIEESKRDPSEPTTEASGPGWGWIASRILKTCTAYSSGVTAAILLSDLFQVLLLSPAYILIVFRFGVVVGGKLSICACNIGLMLLLWRPNLYYEMYELVGR